MATPDDEPGQQSVSEQLAVSANGDHPVSADEQPTPAEEQPAAADDQPAATPAAAQYHSDTDSSSDNDASDAEDEQPVPAPAPTTVEWLATGREKRSTAGNRLKHMLAAQEPDDELELLFAEDGEDAAFSEADEDGSDLHMDSSSDDEDNNAQGNEGDDLEGEKELERKARENRQAARKRKAQEAIPLKFRKKKVKIVTGESSDPSVISRSSANRPAPAPRPKKKSERASWLPTAAELPTRASRRETTMLSKEQLHQQMIEREVKRIKQVEAMERKAKKMEALRKPPKTQAERLAEAAGIEKRNAKSLNRWEEAEKQREEERRAKLAALNNRTLDGPVVTFWSGVGEWVDGKLKHVGKIVTIEEKPVKKKKGTGPDADNLLPGTAEDIVMTEATAPEKIQTAEPASLVKPEAHETEVSKVASHETPEKTNISGPAVTTQDANAQQATDTPVDMPPTPTTNAEKPTSPPSNEPEAASAGPSKAPLTKPGLPMSDLPGPTLTSQPAEETLDIQPGGQPAPPAIHGPSEMTANSQTEPRTISDTQLLKPFASNVPSQDVAMSSTETTVPEIAAVTSADVENQDTSPKASALHKSEDTKMAGAEAMAPAAAPVAVPQLVNNSTLQLPNLEPPSIGTQGLAAPAEGVYTTMGFAPPSQQESINPLGHGTPASSFLARPVGVNPGVLSIPQIGHSPAAGISPPGLAPPQSEGAQLPTSMTQQAPLAPSQLNTAAGPPDGKATRNCFILQNFNENAIKEKSVQTRILFGKEMNKLAKPAPAPRCVITGQPARYKDPRTGLPYYNSFAYKEIQKLQKGEYKFSKLLGTWLGTGSTAATGVPARFLDPSAPAPPKVAPVMVEQNQQDPQDKPDCASSGNAAAAKNPVLPPVQAPAQMQVPATLPGTTPALQTQLPGHTTSVSMPPPASSATIARNSQSKPDSISELTFAVDSASQPAHTPDLAVAPVTSQQPAPQP
ncbi:YL1 nuclear protein-domain-containing protein [Microdochium bolleyi]|uniref:YL1 nuclear protein-domain-containing protein n=1 Tax=Microdochium bolleyi TaxID=196109 RepID=A0A136JK82_9PEZI|nr:YL1 nuclear protein-domain-containing protein [Microdochium bolleyi]